tara:strand:- start:12200 stop:12658 length:459 start_codon:yes stop_codon:yes gene_type:complete
MAEMMAFREGPRSMTDREFFEGQGTLAKQFEGDERALDKLVEHARAKGYTPNYNDVYVGGLAKYPGDPEAFISPSGGRGQIQQLCEKRGWECSGAVNVKHRQPETDPREKREKLGKDLTLRKMQQEIKKNPDKSRMNMRDLRDDVTDKHGGK